MPPVAVVLVAVAAVLHLAWNVLLKTAGDPLRTAAIGIGLAGLAFAPLAALGWWLGGRPAVTPEAFFLAALSGALEVGYFVLLSAAYRRGDLSVVYPIARGTAPLLAVGAGVLLLGERLSAGGWLGVGLLLGGLVALQRPWRLLRRSARSGAGDSAVPFAIATGVLIAAYSAVDRVGVRLVAPWLYGALLWVAMSVGLAAVVAVRDRRLHQAAERTEAFHPAGSAEAVDVRRAAVGGFLTLVAYLLVLGALAVAPLAAVAPLRESAVVLASGWGVLRLGEAAGRGDATRRIGAAGLVLGGAALLALGG